MDNNFLNHIGEFLLSEDFLVDGLISLSILLVVWLLRKLVVRIYLKRLDDSFSRYQFQKVTGYIAAGMIILLISPLWVGGIRNAVTYFGLLSAGIAIALQQLIVDFVGWVFILLRRPFKIGDRIQLGDYCGDVVDIRLFQFSMIEIGNWVDADQSTGRILHLPNGKVFTDVLANYTAGFQFIWNEIGVLITFESNWKKAKSILCDVADRHGHSLTKEAEQQIKEASSHFLIYYNRLTPTVYTTVKDSGVMLTIRYITEARKRRSTSEDIWEDILDQFALCDDIDLAYPTQRFYNNVVEGKPGARAGKQT